MNNALCTGSSSRNGLAVSLCFAATVILSLEALHPGCCAWMGLNSEQSFTFSACLATFEMFLGTFILTKLAKE
jgi:hypothetical protein